MNNSIVTAAFGGFKTTRTRNLYQWDYGMTLVFKGLSLPEYYTVHFANQPMSGTAKKQLGDDQGVIIPDEYLTTGLSVYAWVYLHEGETDGETVYMVEIPVKKRPQPTEEAPTPVQQDVIEYTIAALNAGVEAVQEAVEGVQDSIDTALQEAKDSGEFDGPQGPAGPRGEQGPQGEQGPKGDPGEVTQAEFDELAGDVGALKSHINDPVTGLDTKATVILDTASGAIASFPDGMAAPAEDITIAIEPVQSGSGDPSPTNVRHISGWTGANVIVSPTTDAQDGTTYPISWQSEADTVYGGTLDVTTGLLTVDRALVDLGTLNYSEYGSSDTVTQYYTGDLDVLAKNYSRIVSDIFVYSAILAPWTGKITNPNGKTYLRTPKDQYSSPANFKAALSGAQLVYELATPQTYQLTPTEVKLLLGDNNVWADTGGTTVTYRADTKLYIQKINTPTDDDMIADAQIASGKYFIIGGNLYKSTTTIPAGDTITPGTNCILTNLADALNALNT